MAGNLPYGLQRRLELARAMATSPELLLLDEPAAGMNEDECADLIDMISRIHGAMGYSIILIEHHMHVVMELCRNSTIYVLNLGEILASGSPEAIQNDERGDRSLPGSEEKPQWQPPSPFLEVSPTWMSIYGGIHALHDVNLHVDQGEIAAVIGANGAGKSTLLKTIAGVKEYRSGDIRLEGTHAAPTVAPGGQRPG